MRQDEGGCGGWVGWDVVFQIWRKAGSWHTWLLFQMTSICTPYWFPLGTYLSPYLFAHCCTVVRKEYTGPVLLESWMFFAWSQYNHNTKLSYAIQMLSPRTLFLIQGWNEDLEVIHCNSGMPTGLFPWEHSCCPISFWVSMVPTSDQASTLMSFQ